MADKQDRNGQDQSNEIQSTGIVPAHGRLTRRTLLQRTAGAAAGITAVAAAGTLLPQSTAVVAAAPTGDTLTRIAWMRELADDAPLLGAVLSSSDMQPLLGRYGTVAFKGNKPLHVGYTNVPIQRADVPPEAITLPLDRKGKQSRAILAYRTADPSRFSVVQIEFIPASEMIAAAKAGREPLPFSGRLSFIDANERVLASAIFKDDRVVASGQAATTQLTAAATDWGCFGGCMNSIWATLPVYTRKPRHEFPDTYLHSQMAEKRAVVSAEYECWWGKHLLVMPDSLPRSSASMCRIGSGEV